MDARVGLAPWRVDADPQWQSDGNTDLGGHSEFHGPAYGLQHPPAQIITKAMTLVIVPTLTITTASPLPGAQPGTAYSQTLAATGGTSPYTWTLVSALPAGLTLSPGGQISGTPTTAGVTTFTVEATDSSFPNFNATKAFTLSVVAPLTITTTSPLNTGLLGVAYSQTLEASGGTGPYSLDHRIGFAALTTGTVQRRSHHRDAHGRGLFQCHYPSDG